MTTSAKQLRRDAVRRLADIAGYDHRLDVDLTLARGNAVQVLIRQALKVAVGNELLLEEVRMLAPILSRSWAAGHDATHVHGLPEATPDPDQPPPISLDDLQAVLTEVMSE